MNKSFTYSLLQYTTSEGSGEVLNIGVLLIFQDTNSIELLYPKQLGRLKQAFPGVSEKVVRGFLKSINQRAYRLSHQPEKWSSLRLKENIQAFIGEHLLIPDASSIRFSEVKTAAFYSSPQKIAKDYEKLFLSIYLKEEKEEQHDENFITQKFKQLLKEKDRHIINRIKEGFQLLVGDEVYNFDFAWQNGKQNLVKAISLDVKRDSSIKRKTERFFGQLTLLQPIVESRNLHFDLLLSRPKSQSLYKNYQRALDILERVPHTKIWEEHEIETYTQQTADYLLEQ